MAVGRSDAPLSQVESRLPRLDSTRLWAQAREDVDGEDDRAEKCVPEDAVVEDAREVRPPDADALVGDQLGKPVPLEREPEEVAPAK